MKKLLIKVTLNILIIFDVGKTLKHFIYMTEKGKTIVKLIVQFVVTLLGTLLGINL